MKKQSDKGYLDFSKSKNLFFTNLKIKEHGDKLI
jgi:hypothetical protein